MKFFTDIPKALKAIRQGKPLIILDSRQRENEGDLFFPAQNITARQVNFMLRYGRGLVCTAITFKQALRLELPYMVPQAQNTEKTGVNFSVSVNAKRGISTGVSAFDRAKTIRLLASAKAKASDLARPGHIFPLIADPGGLKKRQGHTEAAVALASLAGFFPAGALCEIIADSGRMAGAKEFIRLAQNFGAPIISVAQLAKYQVGRTTASLTPAAGIMRLAQANLPTAYGKFRISVFKSLADNREHTALALGKLQGRPVLARVHSQCLTGDTLHSLKCDCGQQLKKAFRIIGRAGRGVILYLNQEGRNIGLANKVKAYALQDRGRDTVESNLFLGLPVDGRNYQIAADIFKNLGIRRVTLLSNNPDKAKQLADYGIGVAGLKPLAIRPHAFNKNYLAAKKHKLGHRLKGV